MPAGRDGRILLFLKLDAEFADQRLLLSFVVRDGLALSPHVLNTGVNEGNRALDQVGVGRLQLLVRDDRLRRPDQL